MKRGLSLGDIASVTMDKDVNDDDVNSGVFTQVRGRRKKPKKTSAGQSQTQSTAATTTRFLASQNIETETADCETSAECNKSTQSTESVTELLNEVNSLKVTMKTLQNQLEFVLSFLGVTNITDLNSPMSSLPGTNATVSSDNLIINSTANDVTSCMTSTSQPDQPAQNTQTSGSFADIARKSAALSGPLRNAVVSAVYADFEEKDRRSKNVVISGMPLSSTSDKLSVEKLCDTEFALVPQIVKCRRLGQPRPGYTQPVLVVLQSASEAEHLIKNAKSLRRSQDPFVRSNVYINADLTKAEALTAYHRRCRRRQLAAARATDNSTITGRGRGPTPSVDQYDESAIVTAAASSQRSAAEQSTRTVDANQNTAENNVLSTGRA